MLLRQLFTYFILLITLTSSDNPRAEFEWQQMNSLRFDLSTDEYESGQIYFFHSLLNKNLVTSDSNLFFQHRLKPLDIYNYWNNDGDPYDVLFTKTAYVLAQSVDFFSEKQLSDVEYISETMPSAKVTESDTTYHLAVGFGAPDIDYSLRFYSNDKFESLRPLLSNYLSEQDGFEQVPELVVVQHNFRYSRVMLQKTSKMSISISRYFNKGNGQTLVLNYTLNYIHNMPPKLIGGSDFLVDKIKDGIKALIEETQNLCIEEG